MADIRLICAQMLGRIIEEKMFFSDIKEQLPDQQKAFANMLVLTALRQYVRLNEVLQRYLHKKIARKNRMAQYLLINAAAELLYMQSKPYTVINETVNLVRLTTDKFLASMANAVLRKIASNADSLRQQISRHSPFPESFLPLLDGYDQEQIQKMGRAVECAAPLDLTVKSHPQEWCRKMSGLLLPSGSIRLRQNSKIQQLDGYEEGAWWVQDAAAALPVLAMGDVNGLKVVDLCAAPGGKTAQLAAGGAEVTAVDISAERMDKLAENMRRLGFDKVKTIVSSACDFLQSATEKFDMILLDAPCSASGTFRRHPEVLHIKTMEDVHKQTLIQQQILSLCRNVLKPKGILLYSVCSICRQEGEEQIKNFLAENKDFEVVKLQVSDISPYGQWTDDLVSAEGYIRTRPDFLSAQNGMDSFFICKMQRII